MKYVPLSLLIIKLLSVQMSKHLNDKRVLSAKSVTFRLMVHKTTENEFCTNKYYSFYYVDKAYSKHLQLTSVHIL